MCVNVHSHHHANRQHDFDYFEARSCALSIDNIWIITLLEIGNRFR